MLVVARRASAFSIDVMVVVRLLSERFLGDPKFANDKRDMIQPFHVGPRNCLGRNLAYAEMRLILARLIYNFDMKLAPESANWMRKQRVFLFYTKPALNVYMTPVKR
ncbi:cytochrome P450 monooxygenase [Histoplasma ohiense]|nr:cytochrome P450 monooxygenase [Histoplasma ohiense (nom. inval.)]